MNIFPFQDFFMIYTLFVFRIYCYIQWVFSTWLISSVTFRESSPTIKSLDMTSSGPWIPECVNHNPDHFWDARIWSNIVDACKVVWVGAGCNSCRTFILIFVLANFYLTIRTVVLGFKWLKELHWKSIYQWFLMKMINTWHEMLFVISGESLSPFENEINVFEVIVLVLIILQVAPSLKSIRFGIDRFV